MKTEFDIGQEVWFLGCGDIRQCKVRKILIFEDKTIDYEFKVSPERRSEDQIGATKEELKNKIFK